MSILENFITVTTKELVDNAIHMAFGFRYMKRVNSHILMVKVQGIHFSHLMVEIL
jgi:hypothetical protein